MFLTGSDLKMQNFTMRSYNSLGRDEIGLQEFVPAMLNIHCLIREMARLEDAVFWKYLNDGLDMKDFIER